MRNTFTIEADIKRRASTGEIVVVQNDSIRFIVAVFDNGNPFDLSSVETVSLANTLSNKQTVVTPGTIVGENAIQFDLGTNETQATGGVNATVQLYDSEGRVSTISFSYKVVKDPTGDDYVPSETEQTLIEVVLNDGPLVIQDAQDQANYAKAQGDYAKQVADENKTNFLAAVATVADRDTIYPTPSHGDTVRVTSEARTYRYVDGTGWVVTDEYNPTAIDEVNAQLAEKAQKDYVDQQISNVASGSPKDVYATLTDLQTAYPSGTDGIFVISADGKWYFWNGSAWAPGGIYQSTGIGDKEVTLSQLADEVPVGTIPFDVKATFKDKASNVNYAKNVYESVKDIRLYNADVDAVYALGRAKKSSTELNIIVYRINSDTTTTMVCSYYLANPSLTGVQELTLSANNGSGITGTIVVDVTKLEDNGDFEPTTAKLHRMSYAADLMSKDFKNQINNIKEYKYPFSEASTFKDDSNIDRANYILQGIIDLKVKGAVPGEKYYLRNLNLASNTVQIGIGRYSDGVLVSSYYSTTNPRTGIDTITIPEYQSSGIEAYIVVDWTKFDGFNSNLLFTTKKDSCVIDKSATMDAVIDDKRWRGKKWYVIGDSITNADKYQPHVKKVCGFRSYVNDAVSGQQIITMGDNITGTSFSDIDIVTVFCGANDYAGDRELGTMLDDKTAATTYGALKKLIDKIYTTKPNIIVAFITCTQIGLNQYTFGWKQPNNLGYTQKQYNDAIIEVCNYYSVPVLDLYNNGGINNFNFANYTTDELHPNDAGYKLVGTKIGAFLNKL